MTHPRVAAVDYGTRRIGIAVSDPLRLFAQPLGTFDAAEAVEQLRRIRECDGLDTVVVGWPLTEDGRESDATRRVNGFVRRLRNALPGVRIVRSDERYTSEVAREMLAGRPGLGMGAPGGRGRLDAAVAGMLLQEYLDGAPGGNP